MKIWSAKFFFRPPKLGAKSPPMALFNIHCILHTVTIGRVNLFEIWGGRGSRFENLGVLKVQQMEVRIPH